MEKKVDNENKSDKIYCIYYKGDDDTEEWVPFAEADSKSDLADLGKIMLIWNKQVKIIRNKIDLEDKPLCNSCSKVETCTGRSNCVMKCSDYVKAW